MNHKGTDAATGVMTIAAATTVAALIWNTVRRSRKARALRAERPGIVPVWARATAIVASSIGALLLLVRQKG